MESESTQKINFKKERDFGELISATFIFFKQEYKKLFRPLLYIFAPIAFVAFVVLDYIFFATDTLNHGDFRFLFHWSSIAQYLILILGYFLLQVIVFSYIKDYIDSDGEVDLANVRRNVSTYFWPALGWSFAVGFLSAIGFVLLFIPGLFIAVSTILTLPSLFFDNNRTEDSPMSRSFSLVKGYWWLTFGLGVVFMLILYIIQSALSIPLAIVAGVSMFNSSSANYDPGLFTIIYGNLVSVITMMLYMFSSILLSFHYFNLVEKKEMPSLLNRIDNIGIEQ